MKQIKIFHNEKEANNFLDLLDFNNIPVISISDHIMIVYDCPRKHISIVENFLK